MSIIGAYISNHRVMEKNIYTVENVLTAGIYNTCLWVSLSVVHPKWHPIPYLMHYFSPGPLGNRALFRIQ
jgi:hypothetical protein